MHRLDTPLELTNRRSWMVSLFNEIFDMSMTGLSDDANDHARLSSLSLIITIMTTSSPADTILIRGLRFQSIIGSGGDRWGKVRPQSIELTLSVRCGLAQAAASDDVAHTLDYGALCKELLALADGRTFDGLRALAEAAVMLTLSRERALAVRVDARAPTQFLRADALSVSMGRAKAGAPGEHEYPLVDSVCICGHHHRRESCRARAPADGHHRCFVRRPRLRSAQLAQDARAAASGYFQIYSVPPLIALIALCRPLSRRPISRSKLSQLTLRMSPATFPERIALLFARRSHARSHTPARPASRSHATARSSSLDLRGRSRELPRDAVCPL
jgi:dihydroneopterin aldolase